MIRPRDSVPSLASAPSPDFPALRRVLPFTLTYRMRMAGAILALLVSSAIVLGLGRGLRRLVDDGFKSGDVATLDRAVLLLIGVVVLLAGSTFCRFYLVSWIGERVVADIRRAVFDRVIALSPAYFEVHRTGDIVSRLTTDTTVLQTVSAIIPTFIVGWHPERLRVDLAFGMIVGASAPSHAPSLSRAPLRPARDQIGRA